MEKEGRGKGRRIFVEGEFRMGQKEVRTKKCEAEGRRKMGRRRRKDKEGKENRVG